MFSPKLRVRSTQSDLVIRAKAALILVTTSLKRLSHLTPDTFLKLFDAQIQMILLYEAEVCGNDDCELLEYVHLCAVKTF